MSTIIVPFHPHLCVKLPFPPAPITVPVWMLCCLLIGPACARAAQFTGCSPYSGVVGTEVTLTGRDLNPQLNYSVTLNGRTAPITQKATNLLRFTVPPGATSGAIQVHDGAGPVDSGYSFTVLRTIPGVFQPPPSVARAGYSIAGSGEFVTPDAATGAFVVKVPLDRAVTLTAFRNDEDPVFMAIVTAADAQVSLHAASTAAALAFNSPLLATREDTRAREVLHRLHELPEVAALANLIAHLSRDGGDYLSDQRVENALVAATQAALRSARPPQLLRSLSSPPSLLKEINPDYSGVVPSTPVRLMHTLVPPTNAHPEVFKLKIETAGNNPADWITEILELDPSQFTAGRNSIQTLEHTATPAFTSTRSLGRGYVRANLVAAKGDLIERLANAITEFAFAAPDARILGPGEYWLNYDRPGVYVAQSFSGNLYYGTEFFTVVRSQSALLGQINVNGLWEEALAANLAIALMDLVSVAIDFTSFAPGDANDLVMQITADSNKAVQMYRNRPEGMSLSDLYDLVKTLAAATLKTVIKSATDKGGEFLLTRYAVASVKVLAKTVDILGKISAVGQSIERGIGVVAPDALAVERAVVVIGNPFEPRIRSFYPQQGRAGTRIYLSGFNFGQGASGADTNAISVKFHTFSGSIPAGADPDTYPVSAELAAHVLAATETSLLVEVPDGWEETFTTDWAFISVATGPFQRTSTARLEEPFRVFRFIGPPQLQRVNPDPAPPGSLLTLHGQFFDAEARLHHKVLMDETTELMVVNATPDTLVVRISEFTPAGQHSLKVLLYGRESNPLTFSVVNPTGADQGYSETRTITITRADMSNSPDGEISVLEAFLIANGTLGRPIQDHLPCEFLPPDEPGNCPWQRREVDHISGSTSASAGAFIRDTVRIAPALQGQTVVVNSPMPPPGNGDTYALGGLIFDGAGAPTGTPGLRLDNAVGVQFSDATLRNFPGAGIHVLGGAFANTVRQVTIAQCGQDGLLLEGHALLNNFYALTIIAAGRHGIHLTGTNVLYNGLNATSGNNSNLIERCQGYGMFFDNGAKYNAFYPGVVRSNALGGIRVQGALTDANVIGRNTETMPPVCPIVGNGGHGVTLADGVKYTVLRYLAPAGNQGDGIRLEGPGCAFNQVDGIYTGLDHSRTGLVFLANAGHGIHLRNGAQSNLVGSMVPGGYGLRSFIGGNQGAGVLLDGTNVSHNTINHMNLGEVLPWGAPYAANGANGIHLRNGAHHNTIGAFHSWLDTHILAHPQGAGILFEGPGTDFNTIIGNQIGSDHGFNNFPADGRLRVGIHLKNGPKGNVIGVPGSFVEIQEQPFVYSPYRPYNVIGNATRAGIVLENCGGDLDAAGTLQAPNTIVNNFIGVDDFNGNAANTRGIVLTNNARLNLIGGPRPGQGNRIHFNREAGIAYEDNFLDTPAMANRLQNNSIAHSGQGVSNFPDPLLNRTPGAGVLVQGDSLNNVIGGDAAVGNSIVQNIVGVYMDEVSENSVEGNWLASNILAGVVIRRGQNNRVGGDAVPQRNIIVNNGNGLPTRGGILIAEGSGNRVEANFIGQKAAGDLTGGNRGSGILITNSSGNWIGGTVALAGNTIVNNTGDGVRVTGLGSVGNVLRHNYIGTDAALRPLGNGANGVLFEQGASANLVGGKHPRTLGAQIAQVRMPNTIAHNSDHGVQVDGSSTTGNSILDNSITANHQLGIALTANGNQNQTPPLQVLYDGLTLSGTVPNLLQIPAGSLIQVFADPGPAPAEGRQLLGEATVLPGGAWTLRGVIVPLFSTLTMTATHATSRSTSPFGTGTALQVGLRFQRADGGAPSVSSALATAGYWPVLRLKATALNADVTVTQLVFTAAGTLNDQTALAAVRLYRDADADGRVTPADQLLAVGQFDGDNGAATLNLTQARLSSGSPQWWLLAYENLSASQTGKTFSVQLTAADAVKAHFTFPVAVSAVPSAADFPVQSDTFTLEAATPALAWKHLFFDAAELANPAISGHQADPDHDGLVNFVEYALGLNPRSPDAFMRPRFWQQDNRLFFEHRRARAAVEAQFDLRASTALPALQPLVDWFEESEIRDNEDGTDNVVYRSRHPIASHPQLFLALRLLEIFQP